MIDEDAWTANPRIMAWFKDGDGYGFVLKDRSDVIFVKVKDGALDLAKERSSAHRELAAVL